MQTAKIGTKRKVAQYEFTTAVRGFVELHGGNRQDWPRFAIALRERRVAAFKKLEERLEEYEYNQAMLDEALKTIVEDEKAYWERVRDKRVHRWLSAYTDDKGHTWRDLSDSQVHYVNSPCYQAFVKAFPDLKDPKFYLKRALARLKREAKETAVTNPAYTAVADLKQAIMAWYIGQRTNDIPGQLELMQAIQEQKSKHPLWGDMTLKLPAPWQGGDLDTAIGKLVDYLQERTDELEAVPDDYSYAAELEQHIQATETAVAQHSPVWQLEMAVTKWLRDRGFTRHGYPITDAIYTIYLPDLANRMKNSTHWASFEHHLSGEWRKSDLAQAIHNVKEQLRQQAADHQGWEIQSAIDLLGRNQREVESWAIKAKTVKVAALCAKAANTLSYLVDDLKALQAEHKA